MGVEIFSAGSIDESEPGVETVRYEDPSLGIYKKLFLKDDRLRGVILVGDTSENAAIRDGCARIPISAPSGGTCCFLRRRLTPDWKSPRCPKAKSSAAATASQGRRSSSAIHEHGITT